MARPVRVTYEPGQFSQVNLPDGKKVLVSVGATDVRVIRLGFMNLPMGTVWSYSFGFPIRTHPPKATDASISLMEAVLSFIESCQSIEEVPGELAELSHDLDSIDFQHPFSAPLREQDSAPTNAVVSNMANGVNMIMEGIHARLTKRYERTQPYLNAPVLAAAVVNLLFRRPPSGSPADAFYRDRPITVESELDNLTVDDEIRYAFTQAIRVQLTILQHSGKITPREVTERLEQSMKAGMLVPGGDFPGASSFLQFAEHFLQSAG